MKREEATYYTRRNPFGERELRVTQPSALRRFLGKAEKVRVYVAPAGSVDWYHAATGAVCPSWQSIQLNALEKQALFFARRRAKEMHL